MLSMFREQDCKAGRTKELATKQRLYKSLSLANLFTSQKVRGIQYITIKQVFDPSHLSRSQLDPGLKPSLVPGPMARGWHKGTVLLVLGDNTNWD